MLFSNNAMNKGIEICWGFFLYSFLIMISYFEYRKYHRDSIKKSLKDKDENEKLKTNIFLLTERVKELESKLD